MNDPKATEIQQKFNLDKLLRLRLNSSIILSEFIQLNFNENIIIITKWPADKFEIYIMKIKSGGNRECK